MMNLTDAIDDFLAAQTAAVRSPHTVTAYRRDLTSVANILTQQVGRSVQVADLSVDELTAAFATFLQPDPDEPPKAPSTMKRAWSSWHQLCAYLIGRNQLTVNFLDDVPKARVRRPASPHYLTEQQMENMFTAVKDGQWRTPVPKKPWASRDLAILLVFYLEGLRVQELADLRFQSIVRDGTVLKVDGKGSKQRDLPLHALIPTYLEPYLRERYTREHELLTVAPDRKKSASALQRDDHAREVIRKWRRSTQLSPTPPTPVTAAWKGTAPLFVSDTLIAVKPHHLDQIVERAYAAGGIDPNDYPGTHTHLLRHTFATLRSQNGASAPELQVLLGHESLDTTQRYLGVQRSLADVIDSAPGLTSL
jgi:site-specific recombinase XerD